MKTFFLNKQIWLPQLREQVFSFFADPANLDRLTPDWLKFRMTTSLERVVQKGTLLDYRLRLRGIPITWQSEIVEWQPPLRFTDRQTKGPYKLWVHQHTFAAENGGTLVGDHVQYAVLGGTLVQKLFVAPDLERIFNYRHAMLQKLFAAQERTAR